MQPTDILGVALLVCGCFNAALGMMLMKLSSDVEAGRPLWRRPRWGAGFVVLVGNSTTIDVIVFGLLPLATIASFAGLTIAFSLGLAASGCFRTWPLV